MNDFSSLPVRHDVTRRALLSRLSAASLSARDSDRVDCWKNCYCCCCCCHYCRDRVMASALKHKLAKVLHRGEHGDNGDNHNRHQASHAPAPAPVPAYTNANANAYAYANGNDAAPSPAVARTSEDKRLARNSRSSSVREFVRRSASKCSILP